MTISFIGHDLAARLNAETRDLPRPAGREACLALVLDEGDAGAQAYARRIGAFAKDTGIALMVAPYSMPDAIGEMARDPAVDAIVPLSPLPPMFDAGEVALLIGAAKDAEGQHPRNAGAIALGRPGIAPPTARAALICLQEMAGDLRGRTVAIVSGSTRIGRPLAMLLLDAGATVIIGHRDTRDLPALTRSAGIVVSGTGVPGLLTADHVAQGAILLDIGIHRTPDGLVGDVDAASVSGVAAVLSHVPDGIGPVTTACLLRNVMRLALDSGCLR